MPLPTPGSLPLTRYRRADVNMSTERVAVIRSALAKARENGLRGWGKDPPGPAGGAGGPWEGAGEKEGGAVGEHGCRACRSRDGQIVLDLGQQPACDYFPSASDPGPDPEYPLQMWLCASCGLAQLAADPTAAEEPRGAEPAALVAQAADAVSRVADAGLLPGGATVAEFGSPHGGSWLDLLAGRGLR